MKIILAAVLGVSAALPVQAQYYAPPPPPSDYYPEPRYERPIGRHCLAFLPTGYGTRRLYCPIVDPKPIGFDCACPPPPEYGRGPFVGGRTVR